MRTMIFILLNLLNTALFAQQNFSGASIANPNKDSNAEKIFTIADKMASFPGGHNGWSKYVEKNLDFLIPLKQSAPAGRYNVIVMFVIDERGNVLNIKPLTQHGYGMEAELTRIIEKGPRWSPAVQDGKAVKSLRKQPLTFIVRSS